MDRDDIGDNVLDLRDIVQLRQELVTQMEYDEDNNITGPDHDDAVETLQVINDLEGELHTTLEEYARNSPDMILDDYFEEYAEQYANDIGAIDGESWTWPISHIDWAAAADELKTDYQMVQFDGYDYWIRRY